MAGPVVLFQPGVRRDHALSAAGHLRRRRRRIGYGSMPPKRRRRSRCPTACPTRARRCEGDGIAGRHARHSQNGPSGRLPARRGGSARTALATGRDHAPAWPSAPLARRAAPLARRLAQPGAGCPAPSTAPAAPAWHGIARSPPAHALPCPSRLYGCRGDGRRRLRLLHDRGSGAGDSRAHARRGRLHLGRQAGGRRRALPRCAAVRTGCTPSYAPPNPAYDVRSSRRRAVFAYSFTHHHRRSSS